MNPKKNNLGILALASLSLTSAHADSTWTTDSQEEWAQTLEAQESVKLEDGMVAPTSKTAGFTSSLKRFEKKQKIEKLTVDQSPIWQNWQPTANIGPANLADAPVMLSLGPDNYWIFGRYSKRGLGKNAPAFEAQEATVEGFDVPLVTTPWPNQYNAPGGLEEKQGGYHAWQSRDMKTWVHHGPITANFSRWMTTAEYADGKFYFYYDYPNDQDPHLYIDDNPFDGKPGENMGLAFADPSDGSDCAFIRDAEGKFHVIYENWSPIDANKRSWDSPLAGHAVSENGIDNFEILAPAVDNRTEPTGEIATYNHPHWKEHPDWDSNVAKYEIHSPEQEAYGDWASISIGGQYYLFGDYDPVGGHKMSVGWFTSKSINEPFTWCDHIGEGHPDPDVCFAEGQFYLATQQKKDFTSPGPWVETVEVRVGVDTDNDAQVDQWTEWAPVKESYDYTPGFAKQVQKTPAALSELDLPAGYGFQFEVKMTDTTENKSKPILDKVTLEFVDSQ